MTTAYPPIHHHSTTRIPPSTALSLLSAYLEATNSDPSLHPNALLTENGPITPSSGGNTGLVLHNLRRVEAGLKGEHLGADLTFENFGGEGLPGLMAEDGVAGANVIPVGDPGGEGQGGVEMEGEWQDKEEFEREQDLVQGEIGRRGNAADGDFEEGGQVPTVKATKSNRERDSRKKAKKDRRKQERVESQAKKQREKDAEG